MKKNLIMIIPLMFLMFYSGCSDDATGSTTDPFGGGGGGGGTGNVTFTVALAQDEQQQTYFEFKPSTNVVVTQITANCAAAGVNNDTITDNSGTVYSATSPIYIGPITLNLQTGQQWTFNFKGKIGNAQGQDYNVNSNFTIP